MIRLEIEIPFVFLLYNIKNNIVVTVPYRVPLCHYVKIRPVNVSRRKETMQSNVTHTANPPLGNTKMYNNSKVPPFYGQRMTTLLYINVIWSSSGKVL